MNLVPYRPFRALFDVERDFDKLFNSCCTPVTRRSENWMPAVDIREEESNFVVTADIPGVDPKNIEITVDNGTLSIKGQRSSENTEEKDGYRRVERASGIFHREFRLPDTVDPEKISAKGENGVLEILIPKTEDVKPQRIEVH